MNRLKNHITYLVGPMDEAHDRGHGWREDISTFLWNNDIGVLNPCDKPSDMGDESDDTFELISRWKESEEYDLVTRAMSPIGKIDLHMVDLANFIIMKVDKDIHMCGSYFEACYASLEKKPVVVFCEQGKKKMPNWLFSMGLRHRMFFNSLDEVKMYIKHICYDSVIDNLGRWRFIDYKKVFNRHHD